MQGRVRMCELVSYDRLNPDIEHPFTTKVSVSHILNALPVMQYLYPLRHSSSLSRRAMNELLAACCSREHMHDIHLYGCINGTSGGTQTLGD